MIGCGRVEGSGERGAEGGKRMRRERLVKTKFDSNIECYTSHTARPTVRPTGQLDGRLDS